MKSENDAGFGLGVVSPGHEERRSIHGRIRYGSSIGVRTMPEASPTRSAGFSAISPKRIEFPPLLPGSDAHPLRREPDERARRGLDDAR